MTQGRRRQGIELVVSNPHAGQELSARLQCSRLGEHCDAVGQALDNGRGGRVAVGEGVSRYQAGEAANVGDRPGEQRATLAHRCVVRAEQPRPGQRSDRGEVLAQGRVQLAGLPGELIRARNRFAHARGNVAEQFAQVLQQRGARGAGGGPGSGG